MDDGEIFYLNKPTINIKNKNYAIMYLLNLKRNMSIINIINIEQNEWAIILDIINKAYLRDFIN